MDFGKFPLDQVKSFFMESFEVSSEDINLIIHQLADYTLIHIIRDNFIEGISMKEIEIQIDRLMKELGWNSEILE